MTLCTRNVLSFPYGYNKRWMLILVFVVTVLLTVVYKVTVQKKQSVPKTPITPDMLVKHFKNNDSESLTVVTAYLDLGEFPKGTKNNKRNADIYQKWMSVYKYLKNPLVVYTDSSSFADYFRKIRQNFSDTTKIIKIDRDSMWSFSIKPNISKIFSKSGYPKFYPNTVIPDYTCMTHSKLTLLVEAIKSKLFSSKYYCWLDLGYFRDLVGREKYFYLDVPSDFNESRVGVTEVYKVDFKKETAESIILKNKNWIGGGLFLGRPDVLVNFEQQYKQRVLYYLSKGLMNVEQHILYSMFTLSERRNNPIKVEVQPYIPGTKLVICEDPWFYLGCLMYREE